MIIEVMPKVSSQFVTDWSERRERKEREPEECKVKLLATVYSPTWIDPTFIAIDNTDGDCYVEEFQDKQEAIAWLNGDFEISDIRN